MGDNGDMTRARRLLLAAPLLLAAALAPALPAHAASCKVMRVAYAVTTGNVIVLDPQHYDIAYGACVSFNNNTATSATITVGSHYKKTVQPFATTPAKDSYVGTSAGKQPVTATTGGSSASGSITVAASPSPSPSHTRSSSPPSHSGSPSPSRSPSRSHHSSKPPRVGVHAPNRGRPTPPPPAPPPPSGSVVTPAPPGNPTVAPGPLVTTSPTPSATVVAGPLEPPSGRGRGLPGALAALALVGTAAALVRVLLAEPIRPVDGRENVV